MRRHETPSGWAGGSWPEWNPAPGAEPEPRAPFPSPSPAWNRLRLALRTGWVRQALAAAALVGLAAAAVRLPGSPGSAARRAVAWSLGHDVNLAALERQAVRLGRRLGLDVAAAAPAAAAPAAAPGPAGGALITPMGPLVAPVPGPVSAWFGWREVAGRPRFVPGLDWSVAPGTAVRAVAAGTVVRVGRTVTLDDAGGWQSLYGGCAPPEPRAGQSLPQGAAVCRAAGRDVFFQLRQGGQAVDPAPYLGLRAPSGG